ncbi:MAG: hypothetical protein RMJ28_00625 [Nitrososphaerota archaeon]|nr:hypothetical protein [Candidatus Calditenuaceae archaeon]MDW8072736.1 hypothetical protein [Nitrososphaerota archaeon]
MLALIDTSLLLLLVESGRDVLRLVEEKVGEPVTPLVTDFVIEELKRLSSRADRRGRNAKLALEIAEEMRRVETGVVVGADDALLKLASKGGYMVVTGDSGLQKRLRRLGVRCVYVSRRLEVHISA